LMSSPVVACDALMVLVFMNQQYDRPAMVAR